ncbi:MAG TPA: cytochrome c biogenesis protein CcsA [Bryobacteraceae bacterium]|jgi:ABC-type transport system involved in cytochrome c biogenesis permease subunit
MSVLWLRTAAALYGCGLLYALIYLFRKSTRLFRPALIAFGAGAIFHLVSIVELWAETGHLPLNNFYETSSVCAFLVALLFLLAYTRYPISVFSVCIFPLVFFMTMIGATEFPVAKWSPEFRNTWLMIHISTVLIGFAALIFSALASVYYLLQERQLKRKEVTLSSNRLPPLGTLDTIITQSMNAGFVFITIGTITGVIWAFIESGTGWIGNPKIAFFLFTWAVYLAMIFLRVSAGWRGRRIAWLAVTVLGCSVATWATHATLGSLLRK